MSAEPPSAEPLSAEPRAAVLTILRAASEPLSAAEVARQLGIHVTTARFHLRKLIDAGKTSSVTLRNDSVGRPRIGYVAITEIATDSLLTALFEQLGNNNDERERAAARAGRKWAAALDLPHIQDSSHRSDEITIPDPLTVTIEALHGLGFKVSGTMSAFGVHEIAMCSCPLRQVGTTHPEVARGIARGAIEFALGAASPTLAGSYSVEVSPAATGDCEIVLRLAPTHTTSHTPG